MTETERGTCLLGMKECNKEVSTGRRISVKKRFKSKDGRNGYSFGVKRGRELVRLIKGGQEKDSNDDKKKETPPGAWFRNQFVEEKKIGRLVGPTRMKGSPMKRGGTSKQIT